jgi:hypothetical protein
MEMPGPDLESALHDSIEAVRGGESLEDVLRRYPDMGPELEPLLRLVVRVGSAPRPALSPAAFRAGEVRVRRAAAARRRRRLFYRPGFAWLAAAAALFMLVVLGVSTTVAAAQSSPEGPFYGLRVAAEQIQRVIGRAPTASADSHLSTAEERLDRLMAEAAATGRPPAGPALSEVDRAVETALTKVDELPPSEAAARINRAIGIVARERAAIRAGSDDENSSDQVERLNQREKELTEKLRSLTGRNGPRAVPPEGNPPADHRREAPKASPGPPGQHGSPGRSR